ncbi:two-component sensor histidine kinase [Sulfitobacter sp. M57]|uniref:ATP-binding protein n=1 Tax=unclassified Sulfitobacter TaxID=196795 RepID=UPI0023E2AE59|nr:MULTISPECIES: ATP-binding protein [unclassified Sulfitobacter]MDF3414646.1 two-component sensor histidine kinase [Sulfitobacter sp. KE5]MDF3422128.1 two-component sensor histidine kinase [Sulfitobacter sp. KE43]MDF3433193.1 two-component sensor histidine kinase [Sulfitobacter sp. KE42]MDF3458833.1 two-component sensor histidine kinase [Sulfitobacter sp. S74]MDF3462732.1 two-component sensor histidine kinase [Sulfitobacter sp. Ks18]
MNDISAGPLVSALPFPTLVIGSDQKVIHANAAAAELLGGQVVNQNFVFLLRQPGLIAAIEDAAATLEKRVGKFATTAGRSEVRFDVHIAPADGNLVLTFEDTSEAKDLASFRRDFVANVSHELRTPLASVVGFIETLRGAARDDAAARDRFLDIMEREASRMAVLVDDLLSLSRVEESERKRPTTEVDIAMLANSALKQLDPLITAAKATVTFEDQGQGVKVLADEGQMRQVIGNLVENAMRYGAPAGNITVGIYGPAYERRLRQEAIRLSVRDEGEGIAAHHLPRLAERFYRVDSHRSREVGGTGLGLAIVKHIVHRHRGHLLIESIEGKGSTFTVILPVSDVKPALS